MTRLVVVLGMHRSGTSFIAQILNKLGVELSDTLVGPKRDNPDGFFEDLYVVTQNKLIEEILGRSHSRPSGIFRNPSGWLRNEGVIDIGHNLRNYISTSVAESESDLWGFKDPRTMRWIRLYLEIFDELQIAPAFIVCLRNPSSIIRSMSVRSELSRNTAELILLRHYAELIDSWERINATIVEYENLFLDTERELCRLAHEFEYRGDLEELIALVRECGEKYSPLQKAHQDQSEHECCELTRDVYSFLGGSTKPANDVAEIRRKIRYVFDAAAGYEDSFSRRRVMADNLYLSQRTINTLQRSLSESKAANESLRQTNDRIAEKNRTLESTNRRLRAQNKELESLKSSILVRLNQKLLSALGRTKRRAD